MNAFGEPPIYTHPLAVIGAGLLCHFYFKKTETHQPIHLIALLLGVPTGLTAFLSPRIHLPLTRVLLRVFPTYWTTILISIAAYRVSPWHPLSKYPGPVVCKVTKFWFAFISLGGKQHIYYSQLHSKYGDIVRVGPNELSICNATAVAPLMGPNGLAKGPCEYPVLICLGWTQSLTTVWDGRTPEHEKVKPMIALRDKTEHTRRRRPWTRAFSTAALRGYEGIINARCLQLVELLGSEKRPIDLARWISFLTYDFMNDLAFGGGSEMMRDGDVDGLWHLLDAGQRNAIFMSHVPWLGQLFLRLPNLAKDLKAFRAYAQKRAIMRKKQTSATYKDLFHYLMDEDGVAVNPPAVAEVISDGGLAIIAGADTTSSVLSNLFYFLLSNPVAYQRLQTEIDSLGDEVMDYSKQAHLPYLNGVINESMRLFPPVLSGSQRAVERGSGGKAIGPYFLPEGTTAFIPFFCLHRDPRNFSPLADSFLPERWLPFEQQMVLEPGIFKDQSNVVLNTNAFIPFSTGPSNCVGRNLAWIKMRMLVCLVMHKFDMRFEEGYNLMEWENNILDFFVMMKGRLPVVLTPRNL
ncbi:cytochrome P450 [Infundibulicybe gibba]|nr:cytochrome P450 [Infundibulicybe gibba]